MPLNEAQGGFLRPFVLAVGLVAAATIYVMFSAYGLEQRRYTLAETALQRMQQLSHARLDGMVERTLGDMLLESRWLEQQEALDEEVLGTRWRTLLSGRPALRRILVADEHGGYAWLERANDTLLHLVVARAGVETAIQYGIQLLDGTPVDSGTVAYTDPRKEAWFGRTMEEAKDEAVWHLGVQDGHPVLMSTRLIRAVGPDAPIRILLFALDTRRSSWLDTRTSPLDNMGMAITNADGLEFPLPRDGAEHMRPALEHALDLWRKERTRLPFAFDLDRTTYVALVTPYILNGATLHSTVVLDRAPLGIWTARERETLMVLALLVALFTLLLGWIGLHRFRDLRKLRDREVRMLALENDLAKAKGERDVMGREMHHRVKNNLQLVSSLLNLQATRTGEEKARNEFLRGKQRIDLIALVHHKLYGMADLRRIDARMFFTGLLEALERMYGERPTRVSWSVETTLVVDQDTAVDLGIIVCELMSNAYMHAFPYATGGHVELKAEEVSGDLRRLIVKDNGKGYASEDKDSNHLGLDIVEALAEQLDGAFSMRTNGGTTCEVLFRSRIKRSSADIA
jgi:two-component sensor histidine kinase